MLRKSIFTGVVILLALALASPTLFSQELKTLKRGCCIAGNYEGSNKDIASRTCPNPEGGKFTMVINQAAGCGGQIWGTITSESGDVQKFKGTVELGIKGCCKLKGVILEERRVISRFVIRKPVKPVIMRTVFEGTICKVKGKWVVLKGTYKSANGCTGIFRLKQI